MSKNQLEKSLMSTSGFSPEQQVVVFLPQLQEIRDFLEALSISVVPRRSDLIFEHYNR